MPSYKTEVIIIKRQNFGEADKILTIFSKRYGKKKVIAKGVRRTTSRKGGNVELFNQVVLFLAHGKTFDIVTEAQVVNSFEGFRKDLKRVSQAYYACELVDRLTAEDQEHRQVFELLVDFLGYLNRPQRHPEERSDEGSLSLSETSHEVEKSHFMASSEILRSAQNDGVDKNGLVIYSFELKLLKLLGFWGIKRIQNTEYRIQEGVFDVLNQLEVMPFDQLRDLEISSEILLELERFLKYYVESIAEARIKSSEFLKEV